jgi:hypothetical protein
VILRNEKGLLLVIRNIDITRAKKHQQHTHHIRSPHVLLEILTTMAINEQHKFHLVCKLLQDIRPIQKGEIYWP